MNIAGYEFREGFIYQKGAKPDATAVGNHLEFLRQQFKGELTPEDVLADASHNNSPLHPYFEWSDTLAAKAFRLSQARGLIRSVVAIYRDPQKTKAPIRARAFTHIPEGETSHYRATHHAMAVKSTRDVILHQAWRDLQAWKKRYQDLTEFAALIEVVDEIGSKLKLSSH